MTDSDVQERITSYWSDHGPDYDAHPTSRLHMGEAAQRWQQVWASALPQAPADVLDVGTGTGQVAVHLWQLGHRVTGVDLAEGMLDLARAKAAELDDPPVFRVGDAVRPPLPAASFDAVTARYLLWTLREPVRALRNWRELLRPGGRLAVVDGLWFANGIDTSRDTPDEAVFRSAYQPHVVRALTLAESAHRQDFAEAVRDAGFVDVRIRDLPEIQAAELELSRDPVVGHRVDTRMQFLITARRASS
ncbi:class I SAM-dependent methyltransferase [Streptomyces sp. CC228A]|uniref:class I SAM-dependent methyltransferase n=1 Tax=Streptomyces sp. CC228A TaxID=2898186 RepID=UPI001F349137|nr:class I SAM-dependent methyltransferase [Streptomyces sp. CC228A]